MRKIKPLLLIGVLLFTGIESFTQTSQLSKQQFAKKLDSFIIKLMEKLPTMPGLSISLVDENGPLLVKGYGWLDKEAGIKADENSLFYIASNTKAFMALAAALLDREKKIFLDSSFKKYLPNVQFKNEIGNNITIRNLLTHTSGLQNNAMVFRMAFSGAIDKKEIMEVFRDVTESKTQYGVYDYDNLGYNIYGILLQEYMNKKWQDLLQERIFTPLGMKRTTPYTSVAEKNKWPMAAPYFGYGENGLTKLHVTKKDNTMQSAGGLITTASDLAKWLQVQMNQGSINNKQVFPAEVMKATQTGFVSYERKVRDVQAEVKYALGWNVGKWGNEEYVFHTGGYPGFSSHISFMPSKKIGVALMTNEPSMGSEVIEKLAQFVYDWATGVSDFDVTIAKTLEEAERAHTNAKEQTQKSYADRAKRVSQLSLALEAYTGTYTHPAYGDMTITVENNVLAVHHGNLYAISTPYTQKDMIRVELMPPTGMVVQFKTDGSGKVIKLIYDSREYLKK